MGIQRCRHQSDVEDTVAATTFCVETSVRNCSLSLASPKDLVSLIRALHFHLSDIADKHHILGVTLQILGGQDSAGTGTCVTYVCTRNKCVHKIVFIIQSIIHTIVCTYVCVSVHTDTCSPGLGVMRTVVKEVIDGVVVELHIGHKHSIVSVLVNYGACLADFWNTHDVSIPMHLSTGVEMR